jgi:hypothetical protein
MQKYSSLFVSFFVIFSLISGQGFAACLKGDLNANGTIDRGDFDALAALKNGRSPASVNPVADVNGDGLITEQDLTIVYEAMKNIPSAKSKLGCE